MTHNIAYQLAIATAVLSLAGCADNDMADISVKAPEKTTAYEYLADYATLKTYVNRTEAPHDNIGVACSSVDFLADGLPYRVAVANFDNVALPDLYNHSRIVKASGAIDSTLTASIEERAAKTGTAVIGYGLVADEKQNATYLSTLLQPNVSRPEGDDGGHCIQMTNTALASKVGDEAVAYTFAKTPRVEPGISYKLTMMVKGTTEGSIRMATYANSLSSFFAPEIKVTTSWQKVAVTVAMTNGIKGLTSVLFELGNYAGTLYADNIELYEIDDDGYEVSDNLNTKNSTLDDETLTAKSVEIHTNKNGSLEDVKMSALGDGYDPLATYTEKTDKEKQDIVRAELQRYILRSVRLGSTMTSIWNVVNYPLEEEAPFASKQSHGTAVPGTFFWQDYLGEAYCPLAFQTAATAAADTAKLLIVEKDLEKYPAKLAALTVLIGQTEKAGARVDGIGADLHLTLPNADTTAVANMLASLAATGKLVRINSLTVTPDTTALATDEEGALKAQAAVYKTVVKAYVSKVPAQQRYGITIGTLGENTDRQALWDGSWSRKHAYAGVADGLRH